MLNKLKAVFVAKGISPVEGVKSILGCSDKTARNKLNGISQFSIDEVFKLRNAHPEITFDVFRPSEHKQTG